MDVTVSAERADIEISPATLAAEIAQNVRMILTTVKGTLPLDRNFGMTATIVDTPIERAQALIVKEVYEQLNRYEPRARIVRVVFGGDNGIASDGRLIPSVILRMDENA